MINRGQCFDVANAKNFLKVVLVRGSNVIGVNIFMLNGWIIKDGYEHR